MYKAFYGLELNPFDKSLDTKHHFKSADFKEAISRLDYIKQIRGIGLFSGTSGLGKTYALRHFTSTLNPSLYKVIYISLSTVSISEFYRSLCYGLGIEPSFRKVDMFKDIQEELITLMKDKKINPILIIDEAQYLKTEILNDLKILMNFDMDSKNYATCILVGQPTLTTILSKNIHEALRQRIVINYSFTGISKEELKEYIQSRLKIAGCNNEIYNNNAIEAIYGCCNGSIRKINNLLEKCLIIGTQQAKQIIDTEIVMGAQNEVEI
ncbi:MAG: ATPase [Haloplasmataceae bacterium]|jgi:type II secretory pathway predicted ATPase ExeA|nr:ATPase [Haloplasmataceae bacterium]